MTGIKTLLQLHIIRTKWYGLYYVLRSSQKSIFLKSGQIAIGQNKVFCGANDSIITLQSAGDATITPIKLLEINETNIDERTGQGSDVYINFNASWNNLPTNIPSENLRFYRVVYTSCEYKFALNSLTGSGLGEIYMTRYNFFESKDTRTTSNNYGSSKSASVTQPMSYGRDILSAIRTDAAGSIVYEYKHSTDTNNTAGALSPTMGQPNMRIEGYPSSVRYTIQGYFKYTVYGII